MKLKLLALAASFSANVFAQDSATPAEPKKKSGSSPTTGRERPHGRRAIPKPPVAPPVPDPNKIDPVK